MPYKNGIIVKVYTFDSIIISHEKYYITESNKISSGGFKTTKYENEQLEIECVNNTFEEMCEHVRNNIWDIGENSHNRLARVVEHHLGYMGYTHVYNEKFFRFNAEKDIWEDVEIE